MKVKILRNVGTVDMDKLKLKNVYLENTVVDIDGAEANKLFSLGIAEKADN